MPAASANRARLVRAAWVIAGLGALAFAVEAGEYGTSDLWNQRRQRQQLQATNDSLRAITDSLTRYLKRLESDPALQERIAREEFGMVKEGEILYRFVDSAR